MAAKSLYCHTAEVTQGDLAEPQIVGDEAFRLLINALLIARFGLDALKITARRGQREYTFRRLIRREAGGNALSAGRGTILSAHAVKNRRTRHMAKSNYPHKQRNGGSNRGALIALLVLLIIAAAVFLLRSCTDGKTPDPAPGGIVYDPGAVEGGWNEADTDKIVDALNEKVEQGMINISMNTTPTFQNGSSAGNLMIVNESVNNYPQVVEIHRNDTGEVIYKSGAIPVGSKLETAKLSADLDAGTYECTALFYNVDPDSGEYLGCAGAVITVTVLE